MIKSNFTSQMNIMLLGQDPNNCGAIQFACLAAKQYLVSMSFHLPKCIPSEQWSCVVFILGDIQNVIKQGATHCDSILSCRTGLNNIQRCLLTSIFSMILYKILVGSYTFERQHHQLYLFNGELVFIAVFLHAWFQILPLIQLSRYQFLTPQKTWS